VTPPDRPLEWRTRIRVAFAIACVAGAIAYLPFHTDPTYRSDFTHLWFSGGAILRGENPYALIGPGLQFEGGPLLYPGTALIAAVPFSLLPDMAASVTFVWISAFFLTVGITGRGWHLLPMLATEAFISSARLAQWSIIMAAALFIPSLAALAVAKPQVGLAIVASARSPRSLVSAAAGGILLIAISLLLLPSWPVEWLKSIRTAGHMAPPLFRFGGVFVLLALLRWRRSEAWLVLAMACVPQSWGPYSTLMIFTVAANLTESVALWFISAVGIVVTAFAISGANSTEQLYAITGLMTNLTLYLPAVAIVLRRPNMGNSPAWLKVLSRGTGYSPTSDSSH